MNHDSHFNSLRHVASDHARFSLFATAELWSVVWLVYSEAATTALLLSKTCRRPASCAASSSLRRTESKNLHARFTGASSHRD